ESPSCLTRSPVFCNDRPQLRTTTGIGPMKSCSCESIDVDERVCIDAWPKLSQGLSCASSRMPVRLRAASPKVPVANFVPSRSFERELWISLAFTAASAFGCGSMAWKWPVIEQPVAWSDVSANQRYTTTSTFGGLPPDSTL